MIEAASRLAAIDLDACRLPIERHDGPVAPASRGRKILLSAPHVPFLESPSRVDPALAVTLLAMLCRGLRAARARMVLNLHDVRSLQPGDFGIDALPVQDCMVVLEERHAAIYPYPDTFYYAITHTTSKMALHMTCGLPVLARDPAGVTRFVEREGVGAAYEPDRLAELIEDVARRPERLAGLGDSAGRLAPKFSWPAIIDAAFAEIAERERVELPWAARRPA